MTNVDRTPVERRIDRIVLGLFALLACTAMAHHELWLDEAQHWCVARDSGSLAGLWRNTSGEGHPPLWHWLLWLVTRFTSDATAMQVLHTAIAVAAVALLVLSAPLPSWFRWTAPFGYFLAYEYNAIARNYAPGVLLLFVVCALHVDRRWYWRSLALAALVLTHYWGLVVAGAYSTAYLAFGLRDTRRRRIAHLLALIPFALIAALRILPTATSPYGIVDDGLFSSHRLERTFGQVAMAWWPWPDPSLNNPWNSHVLGDSPALLAWIGAGSLVLAFLTLPRVPRVRVFFALCAIGMLLFPWLTGYRGIRYTGPFVIAWIAAHWIGEGRLSLRVQRPLTQVLLILQVIGAAIMLRVEVTRPFSQGGALAGVIERSAHAHAPVVETRYTAGPVISAVLERKLLYPTTGTEGSWCVWSRDPFMTEEEAVRRSPEMAGDGAFVLLTNVPVDPTLLPGRQLKPIACSSGGMIEHEDGCATLVGPSTP